MKNVAVRDLRQRWPEVEKALEREGELCITRDGQPVARLIRFKRVEKTRRRFDPKAHMALLRKTFGARVFNISETLSEDRDDD